MRRFRLSPDNPVRRRLFSNEDTEDLARVDNFANLLKEEGTRDKTEKMQRWNFDFENELPLDGDYEWVRCDGPNAYIGKARNKLRNSMDTEDELMLDQRITDEADLFEEHDELLPLQKINETTPDKKKCSDDDIEENAPLLSKRRKEGDRSGREACSDETTTVRRNIIFH